VVVVVDVEVEIVGINFVVDIDFGMDIDFVVMDIEDI